MRRIGQRKDRTLKGLRWNLLRDRDAHKSRDHEISGQDDSLSL